MCEIMVRMQAMEPDGPEPDASTASVGHFQAAFSERDRKMKVPGLR